MQQNRGTALLDDALDLARQEMNALDDGRYEDAVDLANRRSSVTATAWQCYEPAHREDYRVRIIRLNDLQKSLTATAQRMYSEVRASLSRSRDETRRMRGYRLAVGQALQ